MITTIKNERKLSFWVLLIAAVLCTTKALWIDAKAVVAQQLIASAWTETLQQQDAVKPWSWADTWPVAQLTKPDGENLYVLNSTSGEALAFGPAHMQASALPGEVGNIVIAGHRDTHFKFLQDVAIGDEFILQNNQGEVYNYRVQHIRIADSRTERVQLHSEYDELQLISCYPFDQAQAGGPLRYVVTALPV
jgi:sortase A